ncbi:heavy metal translocating P-type ATPase [Leptothoe sp. PORK10 BA2]|uniref:heavy metal translocating P-type ATPase n=1 Tax=Leptothoe sp. PORK10 BA2 TaxID=3110254 RepID=UPI002B2196E0|nr:heavy metal translocating P-type ATPase [Leptothoe sp. PORK10 BA2]MEA5466070.1 heavy metal translocating P-type ATPase [Leptothoe sp. PORK10 BA2]
MSSTVLPLPPSAVTPESLAVAVFNVEGMMCAGCVQAVETQLRQCDGVAVATVNLVTAAAAVQYQAERVEPEHLAAVLTEAGFPSQLRQADGVDGWSAQQVVAQQGQGRRVAIAILLLGFSIIGHLHHGGGITIPILSGLWFHFVLATLTLVGPARGILQDGWTGARRGRPNMNTLVSIGALSAYAASVVALVMPNLGWECFFDEPVMLLSFILLGRTLEERARFRATEALRGLIALQPGTAQLVTAPGQTMVIPLAQVQVGDRLQVLPGDKIPVDGQIEAGQTTLDEALVTGESLPVTKQVGDRVIGGTLNQSGAIVIQVNRTGADSTLAQMITLVESAQTRKAPIQRLADTLSGYFTYTILALALVTFLFWYGAGVTLWPEAVQIAINPHHGHQAHQLMDQLMYQTIDTSRLLVSLKLAIAVVVISCPCALGLATPMAILVGSGIGAQRGLLVRGGDVLETAHRLDTVVFDKTGTLTTGQPRVTHCHSYDPSLTPDDVLRLAASVEKGTRHPLAAAILTEANQRQLTLTDVTDSATTPGLGVVAQLESQTLHLGNEAWLAQAHIPTDRAKDAVNTFSRQGRTPVYVAVNQQLVGLIAIADRPRDEAIPVIQQLKAKNLQVQLLSGDRPEVAQRLALELGIEVSAGGMTPADKVSAIEKLQHQGHCVGFVGDGINDAPALAQADIGLAMHSGTDIAMETADIVLMRDDLTDVLAALELSRSTFNKIRQNLAWAFGYNLVCIPLAAGVLLPRFGIALSPGFAGGFMAFSSMAVVLNSLLLRWQLRERA